MEENSRIVTFETVIPSEIFHRLPDEILQKEMARSLASELLKHPEAYTRVMDEKDGIVRITAWIKIIPKA